MPIPGSNSSPEGSFLVYPTLVGGTNFQAPSYSPLTGWFYLEYAESGQQYASAPATVERGRQYIGRARRVSGAPPARGPNDPLSSSGIKAIDPETGKTVWDFKTFQGSSHQRPRRHGRRRGVRVGARRQHRGARRENRQASLALP